ncbi:MAG: S1 RNA-binding domain-containing protein [Epulopiscium sp.]|mgnify:CR=1 FL=1|nr:S1 RNA-binding domain-containing protein [Candidatus Epulonipiscium sp.]
MSENFEVGQIVEGKVTGVKPFGAFVALDDSTQGLVHISHVTHSFLKDINTAVAVGDDVKVKIISIDSKDGKIALSMKEAAPKEPPKPRETPTESFENLMKDFMKTSADRQTDINKRLNR